ncbi:hypothetical protein, partial [Geobacillus stearothermophilus]|uniref:hypothetical protein n=1 Tax=Geobacillus stearothermophilus TaxID=1422 RepID=UPI002E24EAA1|nr:hypothetical protein [Geobacillus stearothermophilus]
LYTVMEQAAGEHRSGNGSFHLYPLFPNIICPYRTIRTGEKKRFPPVDGNPYGADDLFFADGHPPYVRPFL